MLFNPITDFGREEKKIMAKAKKKVSSKKSAGMVGEAKAHHAKMGLKEPMAHCKGAKASKGK